MYAIEFETDITDRFIEIKEYEKVANKHAKVIVMVDDFADMATQKKHDDFIDSLLKKPRHISKDTKFLSRDEANAR